MISVMDLIAFFRAFIRDRPRCGAQSERTGAHKEKAASRQPCMVSGYGVSARITSTLKSKK